MEFFINESQLRIILQEQDRSKMTDYMKTLYSFTSDLASRVMKVYGINVKMLLTWGASVAGLVMPLDNYLKSGKFKLNNNEISLILVGVAMMLFTNNKRTLNKILSEIRNLGLESTFEKSLRKATELKVAFADFLKEAKITAAGFLEIVAYSFLIPIITDIQNFINKTTTISEAATLIAERLVASGVVVVSSQVLVSVLKKIIKKLKS
jgi:hypothetical protein